MAEAKAAICGEIGCAGLYNFQVIMAVTVQGK